MILVQYFARFRELTGRQQESFVWQAEWTIARFREYLTEHYPGMTPLLARSRLAINDQLVGDDAIIPDDATVALLPPVSGG